MENFALHAHMVKSYNDLTQVHHYDFGFAYMGNIYRYTTTSEELVNLTKLDKASRGAGMSLRFKPTRAIKVYMLNKAELICSEDYFLDMVKTSKYNKGEVYEKLISEKIANVEWHKDNKPFTEGGDLVINGIDYQLKFEGATFTNEKTLLNMGRKANH